MFSSLANRNPPPNPSRQNAPVPIVRSQSSDESHSQQSDVATGFRTGTSQQESQQQAQDDTNYDDYIVNNHNREAFIEPDSQYVDFDDSPQPSSCSEGNYSGAGQTEEQPTQLFGGSTQIEQPTQIATQVATQVIEELTQPVTSSPNLPLAQLPVIIINIFRLRHVFNLFLRIGTDTRHRHLQYFHQY